jgi:glycosyltransferase involved in cell wall biosynthesis
MVRRRFAEYLIRHRVDTVVATMSHLWNPLMVDVVKRSGAKLITVIHDAIAHPGDEYPFRRRMLAHELAYSDQVVALSRHVADQVVQVYGYPEQLISIIPHGVFRFGPVRRRAPPRERPFRYLFFGRLLAYKGLDLLIDAMDLIDRSLPIELAIVGAGELGALEARIATDPRIRLDSRWIPESEIIGVFEAADAVVSPYREASQSGVLATAYGAGIPMIATPVGGLIEQLAPYGAGLVADDMTPAAFARAMVRLATEPALYGACVDKTLETAAGPLSWPQIAGQFAGLLRGR